MPATTELYWAQVQVALAPWSHFGWYSVVGIRFRTSGTDVLALLSFAKTHLRETSHLTKFII
jgi:uncharacterized membrane protein YbjE (DUF340 family)